METGSVSEIFSHPKSDVARELIRKDEGDDISRAESSGNTKDLIQSGRKVRIVFSEMQNYLKTCGIELEEVTDDVE